MQAQDAIIGTWVGEATQGENKFETRLTFVSPTGGISRYPSFVCGGILAGDRRDDTYEFNETVTWGGMDEKADGCIHGVVRLTVDGDKMKYEWSERTTARTTLPRASCTASSGGANGRASEGEH